MCVWFILCVCVTHSEEVWPGSGWSWGWRNPSCLPKSQTSTAGATTQITVTTWATCPSPHLHALRAPYRHWHTPVWRTVLGAQRSPCSPSPQPERARCQGAGWWGWAGSEGAERPAWWAAAASGCCSPPELLRSSAWAPPVKKVTCIQSKPRAADLNYTRDPE